MSELPLTEDTLQALKLHLPTLARRKSYLLQNAQNGFALKEVAALTYVCDLLCPALGGCDE